MGQPYSTRKQDRSSGRARWVRAAVAGWLALCGALAHAGMLSVATSQAGALLTLTVSDDVPADMCWGGLCAADFTVDDDPTILEFLAADTVSDFGALANIDGFGRVLVSLVPDIDPPSVPGVLFSLGFRVLASGQATLTAEPRDFNVPGTYMPGSATILLDVAGPGGTVPEPNTALLAALALAGLVWRRRTNLAQDKRPVPSF